MPCIETAAPGEARLPAAAPATADLGSADARRAEATASRRALLRPALGLGTVWLLAGATGLAGCAARRTPVPAPAPPLPPLAPPAPAVPAAPESVTPPVTDAALPAPIRARNWDEFRVLAAQRLVLANPGRVYMGVVPQPLLAIPVLEIELHGDGRVRRIVVLRRPSQALDTIELAMAAVHRAAPYGDVSRLPRPWRFVEVFLFDDERRFKPRTLDV